MVGDEPPQIIGRGRLWQGRVGAPPEAQGRGGTEAQRALYTPMGPGVYRVHASRNPGTRIAP